MKRIHVIGRKNHGKTTLIVELVEALSTRGLCVGTIKHTAHRHELDTPDKDSHRQRLAGARPAAVITVDLIGLYLTTESTQDPYTTLAPMFADCDLVIVEGNADTTATKIEVWRKAVAPKPLAADRADIHALVTDDPVDAAISVPVYRRNDVNAVVEHILELVRTTS